MKERSEVTHNGKAVLYTVLWASFRNAALDLGWTLALHGSMVTDMDIVAIPWIENAAPEIELVKALSGCIGETVWRDHHFRNPEEKPHNRIVYTLSIYSDWHLDLSIMKRV
jgi:hypothetical protein